MVARVNFLLSDLRNRLVLSRAISTCRGLSQKDHGLRHQLILTSLKRDRLWHGWEIRNEPKAGDGVNHGDDSVNHLLLDDEHAARPTNIHRHPARPE